jgi:hypothetical protein
MLFFQSSFNLSVSTIFIAQRALQAPPLLFAARQHLPMAARVAT